MEKQLEALKNVVTRVWRNNAVYRGKMEAAGIYPDDIASLADFRKLPFTVKQDLRDSYPLGMCCASRDDVVRIHASSGTTGKPTIVPYTKSDLDVWSECMAECLATAGVTKGDVFQVILGYGLFTGALGFHYGAERLGATVVPTGGGFTERQLLLMEDMGTTAFTSTPSYALHLSEIVESRGLRDRLRLRLAILGGEAWTPEMGEVIERRLGVTAVNSYGLSEIMGPGVAMECPHKTGMHFNDRHFFMEVLGEDDMPVPDGQWGELAITTLTKEAFPLIRYRTRDLASLVDEPCACGRAGKRLARVTGRNDDMLIIRGVNVFPSQVEAALAKIGGLSLNYCLEVAERGGMKELSVICESERLLDDEGAEALRADASRKLHEALAIRVGVRILRPETLERSSGKAVRVVKVA